MYNAFYILYILAVNELKMECYPYHTAAGETRIGLGNGQGPLLLTWINFNPSMDK